MIFGLILAAAFVTVSVLLFALAWEASSRAIHHEPADYGWSLADFPALTAEPVRLQSPTGVQLSARFFPGKARATVVLLHGFGGSQDEMLPVAQALNVAGYSVFTYDQRGCGASNGDLTFGAKEQDDLIAVVDYLAAREDVDPEQLGAFGFSMGAATLLMTAAREPRLKAIVADSAWATARSWLEPSLRSVFLRPRDRFSSLSLKLAQSRTHISIDALRPVASIGSISPRPVLLIHGSADTVVRPADAEQNFFAARNPKRLFRVPGAGHGATIAPDSVIVGRVCAFLEAALPAGTSAAA